MLRDWKGNYKMLEQNHAYIQWLFPNFYRSAFNIDAQPLTPQEADIFISDKEIADRLVKAYELFLDFLGI